MDVLTELLREVRLEATLYKRVEARAPWCLDYGPPLRSAFHVIREGGCELVLPHVAAPIPVSAGDVVILPHADAHRLRDGRGARVEPAAMTLHITDLSSVAHVGRNGRRTTFLCGGFLFEDRSHPVLAALPRFIHIRGDHGRALPWLEQYLDLMAAERETGHPGSELIATRLSDALFVQAIRAYITDLSADATGWLGALRDPRIASAIGRMHRYPERPWTVASLAAEVGMSRSRFAAHFADLVGQPPLAYLAAWRIWKARGYLRASGSRLASIAGQLGYASEAAFSTAFKRATGLAPGAFRASQRSPDTARADAPPPPARRRAG
jgi:AraC-like DNA-binding protein